MGVRGDFGKLSELQRAMQASLSGELRKRLTAAAAREAKTQVALGFRAARAPSGTPWAPLKYRKGTPLRKTGRLANSFTAKPTPAGFIVGTNVVYAQYHQDGTRGSGRHGFKTFKSQGKQISNRKAAIQMMKAQKSLMRARGTKRYAGALAKMNALSQRQVHETGHGIPARPMVPVGALGPIWGPAIQKATDIAFKNFFSKIAR